MPKYCEAHPKCSAVLSNPLADKALAPTTTPAVAVRRASLSRLHLVGPNNASDLESDVTDIAVKFATFLNRVKTCTLATLRLYRRSNVTLPRKSNARQVTLQAKQECSNHGAKSYKFVVFLCMKYVHTFALDTHLWPE